MYDAVIVGARCAGAALALLLAQRGRKVLMVDRTTFPSDTMSGHYIHPAGVSSLRRLGVLDRLLATDTPAQSRLAIDFGATVITGRPRAAADGTAVGYAPRRFLFDPLLAEAAIEAGAKLWSGVTVRAPLVEGGRVVGIAGTGPGGSPIEVRGRIVVGADGKRSRLAAQVGAQKYDRRPPRTCNYYAYWSGLDADHTRLFLREGRQCVIAPTNHGLTYVGVVWRADEFQAVRADLERRYLSALCEFPWIADRLPAARRETRFTGTADLDAFFREAHGPGWALLGDAGYHKDPITAQGMTDAFLHAELLTDALEEAWSGRADEAEALAAFQRQRDLTAKPMYDLTDDFALLRALDPAAEALLEAVGADRDAIEDMLGVISGTVPVQTFYAPENIARILGRRAAA